MNREFLEGLGLEKEAIDKVMSEYGKSINSYKEKIEELEGLSEKVEGYERQLNDLQTTLSTKEKELESVEDLKKEVESYKLKDLKTSIANQAGLPLELASRLSGETEEEIKADAEKLVDLIPKNKPLPLKPTEPDVDNEKRELEQMLDELTGKN